MLDIKRLRNEKQWAEKKIQDKEPGLSLTQVLDLDATLRHLKAETEELQAKRKTLSKEVGTLKKQGQPADSLMEQVRSIGETIAHNEEKMRSLEEAFTNELASLPNFPMDDVLVSQDKEENEVIKQWGEKPSFSFEPKNHLELNEHLHLFDFQKTAKTSGSGWPLYRGLGARLEWALLSYMMDFHALKGYEPLLPPLMVRPEMMFGSGQLPKFAGQFYEVNDTHPLYLIPTSEVIINGLHFDEILHEEQLPLRYAAYTPCFRRESGAAGATERGLIRVHQFNKVEMFAVTTPEQSEALFKEMLASAEELLQGLGLHYRLCRLVTGDMSFTAARTVDVEVWLPGQNRYYEVSSISTCTDYQARRSKIRYRKGENKPQLVHTLNGSGLATPRLMVALLENHQQKDGSVTLPPFLAERLGVSSLSPNPL